MEIQLISTKVGSLRFTELGQGESSDATNKPSMRLNFITEYSETDNTLFEIKFFINYNINGKFAMELEYLARFKASDVLDEKFKTSSFTQINAPAIAFPYLRSYVSTLTLNSGYEPLILPTINFVRLGEQKVQQKNIEN